MQLHPHSPISRVSDAVARIALLMLCTILPLFVLPFSWTTLPQSKMLLIALATAVASVAWWVARTTEGTLRIPRSGLLWTVALLPIAYVLSTAAAGFSGAALIGEGVEQDTLAAVVMWFALTAVSASLLSGRSYLVDFATRALMIGLSLLFVFQIAYALVPSVFSLGGYLVGNTANIAGTWHDLGILAGLGLFMATVFWRSHQYRTGWRVLLMVLGISSFVLLILIHFADLFWGVFALAAAALVASVRASMKAEGLSFQTALVHSQKWVVLTLVFLALGLIGPRIVDFLPPQLQITQVEVRPSWQGTFDVARQSLKEPTAVIFGSGPNSFSRAWGFYKPTEVNQTPFWDAEFNVGVGVVPTSILSAGIFGLLAWGAIVLMLLGLLFRFGREVRPFTHDRLLFGAALASSVYLLTFHFIYTPGGTVTALTFLSLGLLAAVSLGETPMRTIPIGSRTKTEITFLVAALVAIILVLMSSVLIVREIVSNIYVNRAATVFQESNNVAQATRLIQNALAVSSKNDRAHRAAAELGLVELARLAQAPDANTATAAQSLQATLEKTIQHGLTAVSINDEDYQNWLALATVYGNLAGADVQGALASAIDAYAKAAAANPRNPTPLVRLAQLAIAQGELAAANQYLAQAVALKPDFAYAHYLRSQVEAALDNGDAAVAAAGEAVRSAPQEPVAWFNLGYILYMGGVYADARTSFEQAVSLRPEYANALYMLGLTYYELGMRENAVLAMQRVIELNPSETWVGLVIQNMRDGREPLRGVGDQGQ